MSLFKAEKITYKYPVYDDAKDGEWNDSKDTEASRIVSAIKDIELEIQPGDFVCILGRNGSGKSTLAKHLNALLVPTEGTLWIDGMNSKDQNKIWDIRQMVGMVFQNPDNQIIASVVEEDVAFGPENLGVPTERIRELVDESLDNVDMREYAKRSPNNLSGGQKQRVAIAGALAMRPKCIVLDESTAMLDPKGRAEIMDIVKRLNKEMGMTVISITHYMEEALAADMVYVMADGEIKMRGTPKAIFARHDELDKYGLSLPQISRLALELKERGLDIPDGITTEEELMAAIEAFK